MSRPQGVHRRLSPYLALREKEREGDRGTRPGIHASRKLSHILEENLSIFDKNSKIILDK